MKAAQLTPGTKVTFTPTGMQFEIAKVTDKNISWYTGFNFKGGNGQNNLKMALYGVADPYSKDYDKKILAQVTKDAQAQREKEKINNCGR